MAGHRDLPNHKILQASRCQSERNDNDTNYPCYIQSEEEEFQSPIPHIDYGDAEKIDKYESGLLKARKSISMN